MRRTGVRSTRHAIKKLPEISGVNWHQDQFQVIAGNEVNEMYAELVKMGVPNDDTDSSVQASAQKKSVSPPRSSTPSPDV